MHDEQSTVADAPRPGRRRAAATQLVLGNLNVGFSIVQGIIFVPLYLKFLGAHVYGLWLGIAGIAALTNVFDFGIASIMGQRIAAAYGRRDDARLGTYYASGVFLQFVLVAAQFAFIGLMAPHVSRVVGAEIEQVASLQTAFWLAGTTACLSMLNNGQKNTADALQRPTRPLVYATIASAVNVAGILIFLYQGFGILALAFAGLAAELLLFGLNVTHVFVLVGKFGRLVADRITLREIARLTPGLIAGKGGTALVSRIEPTLVSAFVAPEAAAVYAVTKRAAEVAQMFLDRTIGSVRAGFAHLYAEGDRGKTRCVYATIHEVLIVASLASIGLYLALNKPFVAVWVGSDLYGGWGLQTALGCAVLALVWANFYTVMLGEAGDINRPAFVVGIEALVRLGLMLLLIPHIGVMALPLVMLANAIVFGAWFHRRLNRLLSEPGVFPIPKWIPSGAVILAACVFVGQHMHCSSWGGFIVAAISTGVVLAAVLVGMSGELRSVVRLLLASFAHGTGLYRRGA